jgi:hypothetical protein
MRDLGLKDVFKVFPVSAPDARIGNSAEFRQSGSMIPAAIELFPFLLLIRRKNSMIKPACVD